MAAEKRGVDFVERLAGIRRYARHRKIEDLGTFFNRENQGDTQSTFGENAMRQLTVIILVIINIFSGLAIAQSIAPEPILPDTLRWGSPPNMPGLQAAWILGAEQKAGHYVLRVKLSSGARIPPHTHPDERNTTVLMGTVYVGFGENFDEAQVIAIPAGAVYIAPANVPHYVWAKEGDVMYQEAGMGPTGTSFNER